ncbi:endonuclease domain-containing protein [Microbacterium sp. SS28]|uniref:endonuclease domain-containing protein n=1 Tax=Microbacterium sp. SS28 TaxID=2919948 RepID=UPI001FA9937C|nr:DUF559 domain-containing protein [Microbacterium sp. SS28]
MDDDLRAAVAAGGRLACVSAAQHRGWWIPPAVAEDERVHVAVAPHSAVPQGHLRVHWSRPIVRPDSFALLESVEDTLQHVADCLPREQALILWESACHREKLSRDYLLNVDWRSPDARNLAEDADALADSGLETLFVSRVRRRGVRVRQQIVIGGHPVDTLIGERLIAQIDGFEFHSSAADRGRDVAHDAELAARGYTILRFTYAQLIYDWPAVDRAIGRALAAGLHRAR